jgi:hypothetical protein
VKEDVLLWVTVKAAPSSCSVCLEVLHRKMKNGNTLFFRIEIELINWGNLRLSLSSAIYQWLNLEMYIAV